VWQSHERREHYHRGTDDPDDLREVPRVIPDVEVPAELHHGELEQDQPQPSRDQKPPQLTPFRAL
jgi:hypothetical protein